MGDRVLDFRSEGGRFTGSWRRGEHIWQENSYLSNSETVGHLEKGWGDSSSGQAPDQALLFTVLNSNQAKTNILGFPS